MNTLERVEILNNDGISYSLDLIKQDDELVLYSFNGSAYSPYIREIFADENRSIIGAIEPPGGPTMQVGHTYSEVFNMILSNISYDTLLNKYILSFRKVNN